MASKGKSKTPKIDPALAPTTLCTKHQVDPAGTHCRHCGTALLPFESLGSTLDSFLEAEGIKDEVDARAAAATDDGPVHELTAKDPERWDPMFRGGMVEVQTVWLDRAVQMAKADGFTVPEFIERLIKRQWIASGAGKGKR